MGVEISLSLAFQDPDGISGSLTPAGGAERPFSGWLGLIEAVEELRSLLLGDAPAAEPDPAT